MAESMTVESPCISVCAMDDASGFCMGCYRTLAEIQDWWDLDNTTKQKVLDKTETRQESVFD